MSMKQGNTSRRLALAQPAIAAGAAGAGRIFGAEIAHTAGCDARRKQCLHRQRRALVDGQGAALEARDRGLIQPKLLAQFDLRQSKLAPDVSEVVHEHR